MNDHSVDSPDVHDEQVPELDRATGLLLIDSIVEERANGTFAAMDGESAATWITDRLHYLLDHPELAH